MFFLLDKDFTKLISIGITADAAREALANKSKRWSLDEKQSLAESIVAINVFYAMFIIF